MLLRVLHILRRRVARHRVAGLRPRDTAGGQVLEGARPFVLHDNRQRERRPHRTVREASPSRVSPTATFTTGARGGVRCTDASTACCWRRGGWRHLSSGRLVPAAGQGGLAASEGVAADRPAPGPVVGAVAIGGPSSRKSVSTAATSKGRRSRYARLCMATPPDIQNIFAETPRSLVGIKHGITREAFQQRRTAVERVNR